MERTNTALPTEVYKRLAMASKALCYPKIWRGNTAAVEEWLKGKRKTIERNHPEYVALIYPPHADISTHTRTNEQPLSKKGK